MRAWKTITVPIKGLQTDVDNKVAHLHRRQGGLQSNFGVAFECFPLEARFGLRRPSQEGNALNPARTDLVRS
jgi:hypothetical protein